MSKDLYREITHRLEEGKLDELNPGDTFTFECTEECMGNCCSKIDIFLDPWDVETMVRHLDIPGQQFVKEYCILDMEGPMNWPQIQLKHAAKGPCIFMLKDGKCSVYPARPRNCRTSPLARAVRFQNLNGKKELQEKIFRINPVDTCKGHTSDKAWTVQSWLEDSDSHKYYELSDLYLELIDHATGTLHSRQWLSGPAAQMLIPFLFAPDILRLKLGITPEQVGHEEFYKRRMRALRLVLNNMAGEMGIGPAKNKRHGNKSIMEIVKETLLTGQS